MRLILIGLATASTLLTASLAHGQNLDWQRQTNEVGEFSVELPLGAFTALDGPDASRRVFTELGGEGQITLYGGPAEGLTIDEFARQLSAGADVRNITYQAGGNSWFVLSGYYDNENGGEPLIFYTKVLMSADHQTFSAFEISYPRSEKRRFDPIVERIENSMTRPRTAARN
jgi:hypothetical protein